ncbi:MAG: ShlB/FhaC/HecB family hemolysin secretion/activation protein, partial [Verrucomicrobiaceae bacterium]
MILPAVVGFCCAGSLLGVEAVQETTPTEPAERPVYIREYRVQGAKGLPRINVEEAVYPFLGPGRTSADVEAARAALEEAYREKGFQAASVVIPPQPKSSVVVFQVLEGTVAKLRVKGSRFFDLEKIKNQAPSLREGGVVNFNNVTRDIAALNTWPDRRITPSLQAGEEPGTVDIDLTVEDTFPLHGSLELNNRYSPDTTPLRLDGSLSYNNLWQLGHSIGGSFQISPQDLEEVKVFNAYYTARFASVPWLSLTAQGTVQKSNVSTLGSVASAGSGEILGLRATFNLPPKPDFYHSFTFGADYKDFDQVTSIAGLPDQTPITYFPFSLTYNAGWSGKGYTTEFNAGLTFSFRAIGSDQEEFEVARSEADGSFLYLRGDVSHTHDLPFGMEIFGKVQGQVASGPLVAYEQFGGGGAGTVRGYLEGE